MYIGGNGKSNQKSKGPTHKKNSFNSRVVVDDDEEGWETDGSDSSEGSETPITKGYPLPIPTPIG
jgi:hypothetical protein